MWVDSRLELPGLKTTFVEHRCRRREAETVTATHVTVHRAHPFPRRQCQRAGSCSPSFHADPLADHGTHGRGIEFFGPAGSVPNNLALEDQEPRC